MALYKRLIEINPNDYQSSFQVAQLFDKVDQGIALKYYEQGLASMQRSIEASYKATFEKQESDRILDDKNEEEERKRKERFETDPQNIVPPEILNNIGVLRMELAAQ
jgi:hypothetical protein